MRTFQGVVDQRLQDAFHRWMKMDGWMDLYRKEPMWPHVNLCDDLLFVGLSRNIAMNYESCA